ncbi:MAG: Zn-dependent hydrolase [Acidobacteria bacterium]|nr:MAG: Zn-dependent hydrolase [Acidobacteriota bacterium]PYV76848.1 MAG: Zn-dependent hydrolase [Acidobacteriota bacterium]
MEVVPDLEPRLARFRQVHMPFDASGLTVREQKMVAKLVDACRYLDDIYWRQVDPDGLQLYQSLGGKTSKQDVNLRRYLWINGSRFDLLDGQRPFVGATPMPLGRGFYPQGLTRDQIEQYVKLHPEKRAELYSPTSVVRWHGSDLDGLPYHIAYRSFLEPAARDLREAADLSPDKAFANFLRLRSDALLSDDYFKSDIAWMQLKDPKVDIIFAPYETYADTLLGVKASYGGSILIRNQAQSAKLDTFRKYVADIQDSLPLPAPDRPSKHGLETPMEVMDSPFRTGDLGHGYQAVADNLPNDPRIHEQQGSKKLFFKNFMDARVNYVILPLARYMMPTHQANMVSGEGYLLGTIMHEICHGLGPAFAHNASGEKVDIRAAIGPIFGGLEEAKADVVGMFSLKWLVDHGVLAKEKLNEYYASYIAGNFRTLRFGAFEAHGQAEMMEFNYYVEQGAVRRGASGKYSVDFEKMPDVIAGLAKELLTMEATGDRAKAEAWFKKYDVIPPELQKSLDRAKELPVDIDPLVTFPRKVE